MKILKTKTMETKITKKITEIIIEPPIEITSFDCWIGIDPGTVNLGIALLHGYSDTPYVYLYQIEMVRNPIQIERIKNAYNLMGLFVPRLHEHYQISVIEGASFGSGYRQAELAEVRAAIALHCSNILNSQVMFAPPQSIRKTVFGSAKIKAHEYWSELAEYPDAAAALSCAYYGMMKI